jgi:glucan phosphoethanolaminetransferase (alkaline phosphatase superfamily)
MPTEACPKVTRGGQWKAMISVFYFILILSTAVLFGSEFSVGFFIHPSLARADHRAFLAAIQVFARFFGQIMPIWMTLTLLLHLLLLWLTWRWPADHTLLLVAAATLWIIVIVFSVVGLVPINDRVKSWETARLPDDWASQRRRWDALHAIRVFIIGLAFVALLLSDKTYP